MGHRIHRESETTHLLETGERFSEDLAMFRRYWPEAIARRIMRPYSQSAKNNDKSV